MPSSASRVLVPEHPLAVKTQVKPESMYPVLHFIQQFGHPVEMHSVHPAGQAPKVTFKLTANALYFFKLLHKQQHDNQRRDYFSSYHL